MTIKTILFSGHNQQRLGISTEQVSQALDNILALFQNDCDSLRVLTGAVDGVDLLALKAAAELEIDTHILSPTEECIKQFESNYPALQKGVSRKACLVKNTPDDGSMEALKKERNHLAVGYADIVISFWDGNDGIQGGTFATLHAALKANIPVVWVDTSNQELKIRVVDSSVFTHQVCYQLEQPVFSSIYIQSLFRDISIEGLKLSKLGGASIGLERPSENDSHSFAGIWFNLFTGILLLNFRKIWKSLNWENLTPYADKIDESIEKIIVKPQKVDNAFEVNDMAANHYANRHRDSVILLYLLSTFAVFSAVAGEIHLWVTEESHLWGYLELLFITLIIFILFIARKQQWHQKWLEKRFLAEQLRYLRIAMTVLHLPNILYNSTYVKQSGGQLSLNKLNYFNKQQGLPNKQDGSIFVASEQMEIKVNLLKNVLEDQIDYHEKTASDNHKLHHRLHSLSLFLFVMTVVGVVAHLLVYVEWLLILTAALPALAAGFHGILTKLEWSRVSNKSHQTADKLKIILNNLQELEIQEDNYKSYEQLKHYVKLSTQIMSEENIQWQMLISSQEAELPA